MATASGSEHDPGQAHGEHHGHVAAGGWRRGALGTMAGLAFGLVARLVVKPTRRSP